MRNLNDMQSIPLIQKCITKFEERGSATDKSNLHRSSLHGFKTAILQNPIGARMKALGFRP